jgi:hypothetical protein
MAAFKAYLKENESMRAEIEEILYSLSPEELHEFGEYLFDNFFGETETASDEPEPEESSPTEEEPEEDITFDQVQQAIEALGEDMLPYILDLLSDEEVLEGDGDEIEVVEGVSRIMKKSNVNRKKKLFMGKSAATLRKEKPGRKKEMRKNKSKRRRYAKANKSKIAAYQKSRSALIKKGAHKVKLRKKSGS